MDIGLFIWSLVVGTIWGLFTITQIINFFDVETEFLFSPQGILYTVVMCGMLVVCRYESPHYFDILTCIICIGTLIGLIIDIVKKK